MKYLQPKALENKAAALLESLDVLEVPVPVELIAHRLGLKVEDVRLGDEISGVLVISEGKGMIGVNSAHPGVRQRFTIAHEIGHFCLHQGESDLFIDKTYLAFRGSKSAEGKHRVEIQANQFAAALLMPAELVKRELGGELIDLAAVDVIEELAERFLVSSQSMTFRLDNLGLLAVE